MTRAMGLLIAVMGLGGCLDAGTTLCAGGLRCPPGSVCTSDQSGCTASKCGNGIVDPSTIPGEQELCDDGNVISGDGCRGDCRSEEVCGDAIVDAHEGEECDRGDENSDLGGVCSTQCKSLCTGQALEPGELCDYPLFGVSCLDFGFHRGTIACLRCEPVLGGCGMIGWVRAAKPVGLGDVHDVWGVDGRTIFAVGQEAEREASAVARYDGVAWTSMAVPFTTGALLGVWAGALSDVFAVGEAGRVLRYNGQSWVRLYAGTGATLRDVWSSGADGDVLVVGDDGTVLRFARGTTSWTPEPLPAEVGADVDFRGLWGSGPDDVFAVGAGGTVLHYDGAGWQRQAQGLTTAELVAVWGSGPDDVFAVGTGGTVLHYDGTAWSAMVVDTAQRLSGVWGSGPAHVMAVGDNGTTLLYDGQGWIALEPDTDLHLAGVWGADAGSFVAVGQSGMILTYQGQSWAGRKSRPTSQSLHRLWARTSNDVYALAASEPFMLHFDGRDWRAVSESAPDLPALLPPQTGSEPPLRDLWGNAAGEMYAVGEAATILRRGPGGDWARVVPDPAVPAHTFTAVWGTDDGHLFVVGAPLVGASDAIILHHDGARWTEYAADTGGALLDVWGNTAQDVVAVGARGAILQYDGITWQRAPTSSNDSFQGVWSNGDVVYAVGAGGTVLQRARLGWREVMTGGSPLQSVWGRASTDVYAAGADGTILRLTGAGWSPVRSNTDHRLLGVWGVGGGVQTVMFAGEGGTFLRLLESKSAGAY